MALGEVPNHSDYNFHNNSVMHHRKDDHSKKSSVSINSANGTSPADEPTSLLFAMQNAFREKLAKQMTSQKKGHNKHKRIGNENSLLELCEKSQNLMKKYNESYKENSQRGANSGITRGNKKLPPISGQKNVNSFSSHTDFTAVNNSSYKKSHYNSKLESSYQTNAILEHKECQPSKFTGDANTMQSDDLSNLEIKQIEDSPPDVSKLRLVRNKRRHELLKVNKKHSSPNIHSEKLNQPISNYTAKANTKMKHRNKNPEQLVDVNIRNQLPSTAHRTPVKDFQKWQAQQDEKREKQNEKHRIAAMLNEHEDEKHEIALNSTYIICQNDVEQQSQTSVGHKNTKRKQVSHYKQEDNASIYLSAPLDNEVSLQTKLMTKSPDINKIYDMSTHSSVIPGLNKPVLVRHDGRSNVSSRTSTRNAFHIQSKPIPPAEEGVFEKNLLQSASWVTAKTSIYPDYDSASILEPEDVVLVPCRICGRKFRTERIEKHASVCSKASQRKRKVYNMSKARKKGTDLENFTVAKSKSSRVQPKKSNWRNQHEEFIKTIRHAKMVTSYMKGGGNVADLPPPEPSANPDYVTCDYCQRRFAPNVAERHIPRCKDIKARPAPPKSKYQRNKR